MKFRDRERRRRRVAADFVESEEPQVPIARGVFQRLCHQRPGELLDFRGKFPDACSAVAAAFRRDQVERERSLQEIENRLGPGPARSCLADGSRDGRPIDRRDAIGADVGPVDRKVQQIQPERLLERRAREIAAVPVTAGDPRQPTHEHVELGREQGFEHDASRFQQDLGKIRVVARNLPAIALEGLQTARIDQ